MAHADYDCCAVCDNKMNYAGGDATTKTHICSNCVANLAQEGVIVHGVGELIDWAEKTDLATMRIILTKVGFSCCLYVGEIDAILKRRGIEFDLHSCKIVPQAN